MHRRFRLPVREGFEEEINKVEDEDVEEEDVEEEDGDGSSATDAVELVGEMEIVNES